MILVFGAHRPLGRLVVHELAHAGIPHRALLPSRQVVPGEELQHAEVVIGAPDDGHAVDLAVAGATAVILITPSHPQQVAHEQHVVSACQRHRVSRVVKLSSNGADADAPYLVGRWHWHTERLLAATRLDWTVVRTSRPMQYLNGQLPSLLAQHAFYGCQGDGRSPDIDQRDVAAVLTAVALQGLHIRETLLLTGPEALTGNETAERLSAAMEQPVAYVDCTSRDFIRSQMADGLAAWKAEDRAAWQREVRDGHYAAVNELVQGITGRPARTLGAFARELANSVRYARSRRGELDGGGRQSARPGTPADYAAPT